MNQKEVKRNVTLYKWFFVLVEPLFIGPTLIFYLQNVAKMSLSHVYVMEAVVVGGFVLLEVPSGALADLIGRKKTIFLGALFQVISKILLVVAVSPIYAWVSNIFWMFSLSMRSGADEAFLYDSLKEAGREKEYEKIQGRAFSYLLLAIAFCSLSAGFLSEIHLRLPFIVGMPFVIASCFVVLLFKEAPKTEKYSVKRQKELLKLSWLFVKNHKKIKWIIAFATLIAVSSKVWFFSYNPYFELVDFDLKYYGVMFFFFNIIAWFFSRNAYKLEKKIGEKFSIISMILLIGMPIILMATFVSKVMVSMTLLQNIVRGFKKPFVGGFLNRHIEDSNRRATILSIESAAAGLASFFALNLFGVALKFWTLTLSLQMLGIFVLIIGSILILQYRKIFLTKSPS